MAGDEAILKLQGLAAKPPSAKVFNCPSCGAGITLRAAGQTVTAVCGSCGAIIDSTNENYRVVEKVTKAQKFDPLIPLGQRGKLKGILWEVIGYMERADGAYSWSEYLLFNPTRGFRWLTEFDGHWNYVLMTKDKPTITLGGGMDSYGRTVARYLNKQYFLFNKGTAKVTYVLGEFYWQVRRGEKTHIEDYIRPPEILSCEKTNDEVVWSLGEYVEANDVKSAFQIKAPMPNKVGVAPNQTSTVTEAAYHTGKYWFVFFLIILFIQVMTIVFTKGETVYTESFKFSPMDSERIRVSPPFDLKYGTSNVEIDVSAPVSNNWLEVQGDLVNDDDGGTYEFEQGVEYYSGYDSDGFWAEGSQKSDTTLSAIPSGKYHLNLEVSGPALPALSKQVEEIPPVTTPASAVPKIENWPNGKVKSNEPMVDGKIEGLAKYFYENENPYMEISYLNGQKHGKFKLYRPDGTIEQELSYKNDKLNGVSKWYDGSGDLTKIAFYSDGAEVSSTLASQIGNSMMLNVTVRRDVVTWSNFFWALFLISIYPLFIWWRNRSFEMSRWSQSDFSPYYSATDDDED
jgi:hypothetical protein